MTKSEALAMERSSRKASDSLREIRTLVIQMKAGNDVNLDVLSSHLSNAQDEVGFILTCACEELSK